MTAWEFGLVLPTGQTRWDGVDARRLLRLAARAEELGFASLWAGDTLLRPVVEPLTTLAAVAAVTERVRLGPAALLPAFRRPVQAAQAIASLDQLSGGRVTLTVGAGLPRRSEPEYALSEVPWPGRYARLDETVALWRRMWTDEGRTSFHGKAWSFDDIPPCTPPAQPGGPPIWLGGASPAALVRTGRYYDGWLPYPPDPDVYTSGVAEIQRVAASAGRPPLTTALYVTILVTPDPVAGRAAFAEYTQLTYRMPVEVVETIQLLIAGPLETVHRRLEPYVRAGASHIVVRSGAIGLDAQFAQLELLAELLDGADS
jgi:alkanesulfonate monooxygenase SsuD/methylene tetrahydromethanopterin reductase-like flavin-dependent oxidoreductase (luciferase family)